LSFARDTDTFCAKPNTGSVSFEVEDGVDGKRQHHAALLVTPIGGPGDEIPVRVHHASATVKPTERDQLSPWRTPAVNLADVTPACIVVALVPNPWAPTPHPLLAPPGLFEYSVSLHAAREKPQQKP
jgi:hypothetical protein